MRVKVSLITLGAQTYEMLPSESCAPRVVVWIARRMLAHRQYPEALERLASGGAVALLEV